MDEQKIAESDLIIDHRTYCFNPKGECHWSCGKDCEWHYKQPMIKIIGSLLDTYWDERCDKEEAIRVILALIAEDREKHNTLRWHTAKKHFDDGVETQEDRDILSGLIDTLDCAECMKQAKLAFIEREAGLVEALREAKKDLESIQGGEGPYNRDPLKHLENCYEHMIETAGEAVAKIDAAIEGRK